MKVICRDRQQKSQAAAPEGRVVNSVSADVDRLLGPKTYEELEVLEKQIVKKLNSNEPIDVDYWEQLLRSLTVWKARARLKKVYQSVIDNRLQVLKKQQEEEADLVREKLQTILAGRSIRAEPSQAVESEKAAQTGQESPVTYSKLLDPDPQLKIRPEDKSLEVIDEKAFLQNVVSTHLFYCLLAGFTKRPSLLVGSSYNLCRKV